MKLKNLNIHLCLSYEDNAGRYIAIVQYADERDEIKFALGPEIAEDLLVFLGPLLVKHSAHAAKELAAVIQLSVNPTKELTDANVNATGTETKTT